MKRFISVLLVFSILTTLSFNAFAQETVVLQLDAGDAAESSVPEAEEDSEVITEDKINEELIPDTETESEEALEDISEEVTEETLDESVQETPIPIIGDSYISLFEPDSGELQQFMDEISYLENESVSIDEDVLDNLILQICPQEVDALYIEPSEGVPYDEIVDDSMVEYNTLEETESIRKENARIISEYSKMMENGELTEGEIDEYGLRGFLQMQDDESQSMPLMMSAFSANLRSPSSLSAIEGCISKAPMLDSGYGHTVYLDNTGQVWTWGKYSTSIGLVSEMPLYKIPTKIGLSSVIEISAGVDHSIALKSDGTVWQWGHYFEEYELGSAVPAIVPQLNSIVAISAGSDINLALKSDGTVWQWNVGTTSISQVPQLSNVRDIAAGCGCGFALLANGELWSWGSNYFGQLGNNSTENSSVPVRVLGVDGIGYLDNITQISATDSVFALLSNGCVVSWGNNNYNKLGNSSGTYGDTLVPHYVVDSNNTPITDVVSVYDGYTNCGFIKNDASLWIIGNGDSYQLGTGTQGIAYTPVKSTISDVICVSFGYNFTVALQTDSSINSVGSNTLYSLGIGEIENYSTVPFWVNTKKHTASITQVSCDYDHTLVLKSDGTLWASGSNTNGRLGNNNETNQAIPVQVCGENADEYLENVVYAATGRHCSMAIQNDGALWVWGSNFAGQFGNNTKTGSASTPVRVSGISGTGYLDGIASVDLGYDHAIALTFDGNVLTWGNNSYGQLGRTGEMYYPEFVPNLTDVIAVSATGEHSLALKSDGSVWAWGRNQYGQLGVGNTANAASPVQVVDTNDNPISDIIAISAGRNFSLALKADGTVLAWGQNNYGQLGDNTKTDKHKAVAVNNLSNVSAITTGHYSSFAICSDGSAWGWGSNGNGNLGVNDNKNKSLPTRISGELNQQYLGDISMLAAGLNTTMALKSDGTLLAWGYNQYGQFGISTTGDKSYVPVMGYVLGISFDDYADDFENSTYIVWDQTITGEINEINDVDCFSFTSPAKQVIIENPDNLQITVYDSSYNLIYPVNRVYDFTTSPRYYIKVQSYNLGEYCFELNEKTSSLTAKDIICSINEVVDIVVSVRNMSNITQKIFKLSYDPVKLITTDMVVLTYKNDLSVGVVDGYPIEILSIDSGEIRFKYLSSVEDRSMSGVLNIIRFKSLSDEESTILLELEE